MPGPRAKGPAGGTLLGWRAAGGSLDAVTRPPPSLRLAPCWARHVPARALPHVAAERCHAHRGGACGVVRAPPPLHPRGWFDATTTAALEARRRWMRMCLLAEVAIPGLPPWPVCGCAQPARAASSTAQDHCYIETVEPNLNQILVAAWTTCYGLPCAWLCHVCVARRTLALSWRLLRLHPTHRPNRAGGGVPSHTVP